MANVTRFSGPSPAPTPSLFKLLNAVLDRTAVRASTGFITDGYSYGLNTDHIRKIDIRRTAALVFFTSGEQELFGAGSPVYKALRAFLDHQDSASHHVIPAAPGYTLLTLIAPMTQIPPPSTSKAGWSARR